MSDEVRAGTSSNFEVLFSNIVETKGSSPKKAKIQADEVSLACSKDQQVVYSGIIQDLLPLLKRTQSQPNAPTQAYRDGFSHAIELLDIYSTCDITNQLEALKSLTWLVADYKAYPDEASKIFVEEYLLKANDIIASQFYSYLDNTTLTEATLNYVLETVEQHDIWAGHLHSAGMKIVTRIVRHCLKDKSLNYAEFYKQKDCDNNLSITFKLAKRILKQLCSNYTMLQMIADWTVFSIKGKHSQPTRSEYFIPEEDFFSEDYEDGELDYHEQNRRIYRRSETLISSLGAESKETTKVKLRPLELEGVVNIIGVISSEMAEKRLSFEKFDRLLTQYSRYTKKLEARQLHLHLIRCLIIRIRDYQYYQVQESANSLINLLLDKNLPLKFIEEAAFTLLLLLQNSDTSKIMNHVKHRLKDLAMSLTQNSLWCRNKEIDRLLDYLAQKCYEHEPPIQETTSKW